MSSTMLSRAATAPRSPSENSAPADDPTLIARAQSGEQEALERIVAAHLPLVRRLARRFHSPQGQEELDDLIQTGNVAVLEAIARFDPERGAFSSYAAVCVSGALKRHFRDRSWRMRIPRPLHDAALSVRRSAQAYEAEHESRPSTAKLAELTGLEPALVREAQEMLEGSHGRSLQETLGEGPGSFEELIGSGDEGYARVERRLTVDRLTAALAPRERKMLALRFGMDRTQLEIADEIGISQMQVSRLLAAVLAQMREQEVDEAV